MTWAAKTLNSTAIRFLPTLAETITGNPGMPIEVAPNHLQGTLPFHEE